MYKHTLKEVSQRIQGDTEPSAGCNPVIAIKEWVDDWNRHHQVEMVREEPLWILDDHWYWVNLWIAGAAEYAAFLTDAQAPEWTADPRYFSKKPILAGGPNARHYALMETPFAWRRRMLFSGRTTLRGLTSNG